MKKLSNDIFYLGVDDNTLDLFESQFPVPNGISYNSYMIEDEKIAVFDTVDVHFCDEWLKNLDTALQGRIPDYLIIEHMEPDHSSCVLRFKEKYPTSKIVGNSKIFVMLNEFFGKDYTAEGIVVKDGDKLSLGKHELIFIFAPMVHWPEVMVVYDSYNKALFSADAFGKFGIAACGEEWADEARRYYFGIVGKYGTQVKSLLNKVSAYEISVIYPLHGPVLNENLNYYINLYSMWADYRAETDGVMIAYTSVYGHTKYAVEKLAEELKLNGVKYVSLFDLARNDISYCLSEAFKCNKIVFATTTYNGGLFPAMNIFLEALTERNFQGRKIGIIENGSWAPVAAKAIMTKLEKCKNLIIAENQVKIRSALNEESENQLKSLAEEMSK